MIVSTATAVLPVWRSPMISSRWPRPTGTIASMAFRPVCTGCETDWRAITPGATFSMTSVSLALTGPLPSMGWPSEFTTRPRSSGPTGTDRILPVVFTASPSVMCSYSPRITAPTESRSRLSARPKVFFGNSSISPCMTSERPWIRQMPSVTDTTVPCVRICTPASMFWMRFLMSSEISDGLSCICCSLSFQGGFERAQLRARGTVDNLVADHDFDAADERFVHTHARPHLAAGFLLEPGHQVGALGLLHFKSRIDLGLDHAFALALEHLVLLADLARHFEAAVLGQHADEVLGFARKLARKHGDEQAGDLGGGKIRIADRCAHARLRLHRRGI